MYAIVQRDETDPEEVVLMLLHERREAEDIAGELRQRGLRVEVVERPDER